MYVLCYAVKLKKKQIIIIIIKTWLLLLFQGAQEGLFPSCPASRVTQMALTGMLPHIAKCDERVEMPATTITDGFQRGLGKFVQYKSSHCFGAQ